MAVCEMRAWDQNSVWVKGVMSVSYEKDPCSEKVLRVELEKVGGHVGVFCLLPHCTMFHRRQQPQVCVPSVSDLIRGRTHEKGPLRA